MSVMEASSKDNCSVVNGLRDNLVSKLTGDTDAIQLEGLADAGVRNDEVVLETEATKNKLTCMRINKRDLIAWIEPSEC